MEVVHARRSSDLSQAIGEVLESRDEPHGLASRSARSAKSASVAGCTPLASALTSWNRLACAAFSFAA